MNAKKVILICLAAAVVVAIACAAMLTRNSNQDQAQDNNTAVGNTAIDNTVVPDVANQTTILIAAAASLENALKEQLIPAFETANPDIKVEGTYDSSGKLQTQIEAGLEADIFFSAATKQMTALQEQNLIAADSIVNLLENQIVLIASKDVNTKVTDFNNVADALSLAIGDPESVPAGQYAKEIFTSLGIWEQVLPKASLGTNVTEVLSWVAAGSAEVGVVYATDAKSNANVAVLAQAPAGSIEKPVVYPIGITANSQHQAESELFIKFLQTDQAKAILESYGFTVK